ncbi:MAG: ParA family protein [Marinospirillum sp.]|uniref:ParA family protein n=1 Tax=Marinospirillum sp. TaxID=2183934 RepID=UPI0019E20FFB|nr:ParA family protein [Marinospirillum sp.]MBE0505171.1 ParA family protein [Marinospirillum sp.]
MIIAIANRKGGTGKTTSCVNLAAVWGRQGYRVLVIDLDTQGHSALGLGRPYATPSSTQPTSKTLRSVHGFFQAKAELIDPQRRIAQQQAPQQLRDCIDTTPTQGVDLIAADVHFDGRGLHYPVTCLRDALQQEGLTQDYQRIILDTPPTLDSLLMNAAAAAQGIVVPFVPHHLGKVGALQLARLFYDIASNYNDDLTLLGLLPVMLDQRLTLHRNTIDELGAQFGQSKMLRGIRNNIRLAEAFAVHQSVLDYAPRSSGAMDYTLLAAELDALWGSGKDA